ncbi:MAG: prepilin peptidase [Dehalococcoidia bacterium]
MTTASRRLALGSPTRATALLALALATLVLSTGAATALDGGFVLQGVALGLVVLAAAEDLRTRRIRNALVVPALLLALLGASDLTSASVGALLAPLPLLALSAVASHAMGMGDVKLTAPAGALAGLANVPSLWLGTALAGGILSVIALVRGGRRSTLAYGPAIALGLLATLLQAAIVS